MVEKALSDLRNELSNTFGIETSAHDVKNHKDLTEDEIVELAEAYIELRKLAYALVTKLLHTDDESSLEIEHANNISFGIGNNNQGNFLALSIWTGKEDVQYRFPIIESAKVLLRSGLAKEKF